MKYSDFNLVANPSGQGYIQDGTERHYTTSALDTFYPTGYPIPYGVGYDSDGNRVLGNKGRVKYNPTITDVSGIPIVGGTWISTNYFTIDEAYDLAVKADTGDYIYDDTDPSNVVGKVIPISDANYGDYFFVSLTKGLTAIYETPQTGTNLVKIKKEFNIT